MKSLVNLFSTIVSGIRYMAADNPSKINFDKGRGKILELASRFTTPDPQPEEIALQKLLERIENPVINSNRDLNRNNRLYYISIAASVVLILLSGVIFLKHNSITKVAVAAGRQVKVYLPDSSEVIINSASIITYNSRTWKTKRLVKLDGEAFFKVRKGKRFEIQSRKCITTVLGTIFDICAREGKFKVSCFAGKISVRVKDNSSEKIINPGYETSMDENNILTTPYKYDTVETGAWRKGEFYFHNEPLNNVFDEMERQFNVIIAVRNIKDRRYTGYFSRNTLNQALKLVCDPMQLDYTINGNIVNIRIKAPE